MSELKLPICPNCNSEMKVKLVTAGLWFEDHNQRPAWTCECNDEVMEAVANKYSLFDKLKADYDDFGDDYIIEEDLPFQGE